MRFMKNGEWILAAAVAAFVAGLWLALRMGGEGKTAAETREVPGEQAAARVEALSGRPVEWEDRAERPEQAMESQAASVERGDGIMRIVSPVRLGSVLGEELEKQVADTRRVLDRFRRAGFTCAVWAVDEVPENAENLAEWAQICLGAFPDKPILALDSKLHGTGDIRSAGKLAGLLEATKGSLHSVIVNYTRLNNYENLGEEDRAIRAVMATAKAVQEAAPDMFLWLLVDDDPRSVKAIGVWAHATDEVVDGYWVYRWHTWDEAGRANGLESVRSLLIQGKPVIRAGFRYVCPRVRPGIESDLSENYRRRLSVYEEWIREKKYAGYARLVGSSMPSGMEATMTFVTDS